jgi:hypothetical protein
MNKIFSFYDAQTGIFSPRRFGAPDAANLALNTPAGHVAIEGAFDRDSQRVDVESGTVIDYQSAAPDEFHVWNSQAKQWEPTAERAKQLQDDEDARAQLDELDRKTLRALLEAQLGIKPTKADRDAGVMTLEDIQAAKTALRSKLIKP